MKILAKSFNNTNGSFTIVIQSEQGAIPYTVDVNNPKYNDLKRCFLENNAELFIEFYVSKPEKIEVVKTQEYVKNTGIEILENKILYNGEEIHNVFCQRILDMRKDNMPIEPMVAFLENLLKNPSNRSRQELPDFLLNRNLPITDDGYFLAYKSVRSDFYSKTSGTLKLIEGTVDESGYIYNGVGEKIRCDRADVDDERSNECSYGLHVGGLKYSGPGGSFHSYGDKVVIVKVNPADIVSVPRDYNAQKVRTCAYEVISEFKEALPDTCHGVERVTEEVVYLNFDEIEETDQIDFLYPDKNGNLEGRKLLVDEIENWGTNDDSVSGYVMKGDPSYEIGEEYRRFKKNKMSKITYVVEKN